MSLWESLQILELSGDADLADVKKAYIQKSKNCHPEEKPEEWKQLYEAYKTALFYLAKNGSSTENHSDCQNRNENVQGSLWSKTKDLGGAQEADEAEAYEELFRNIQEFAEQKRGELCAELERQIVLLEAGKKVLALPEWKRLFSSEAFVQLRKEDWVVERVSVLITQKRSNFSAVPLLYETLMLWENELQASKQQEAAVQVQETLHKLKFRWNLTDRNIRRMGKERKQPLWMFWKNFWGPPWWRRGLIMLLVSAVLIIMDPQGSLFFAGYLFLEWFYLVIKKDRWYPQKKTDFQVKSEKIRKKRPLVIKILYGIVVFAVAVSFLIVLEDALHGGWTTEIHSCREILRANKKYELEEIREGNADYRTYFFYLLNEGLEEERVLVIPSYERAEFTALLEEAMYLHYNGDLRYTSQYSLTADIAYYYPKAYEMTESSDYDALFYDIAFGTTPVEMASQWLNQEIYWVDSFQAGDAPAV